MAEAKTRTVRVKKNQYYANRYDADETEACGVYVSGPAYVNVDELNITITPVLSREERLREARVFALSEAANREWLSTQRMVDIIERVDAEFAKENP